MSATKRTWLVSNRMILCGFIVGFAGQALVSWYGVSSVFTWWGVLCFGIGTLVGDLDAREEARVVVEALRKAIEAIDPNFGKRR